MTEAPIKCGTTHCAKRCAKGCWLIAMQEGQRRRHERLHGPKTLPSGMPKGWGFSS